METSKQFEIRKKDHVRIALSPEVQTSHLSRLDEIQLVHEALPEIDFTEVHLETDVFGFPVASPLFISSMTAGHEAGRKINLTLAQACAAQGWMMGVGSQRRELLDSTAAQEWREIRQQVPNALLFGNLGLTQLIQTPVDRVKRLVDNLEAGGLFIHTNPLQECLQPEGTPQFRGGLEALERLCHELPVPVVLKEVGCGFSEKTFRRLQSIGLAAVDVSGSGGTHWGRVETQRRQKPFVSEDPFKDWGISSVSALLTVGKFPVDYQVWASGGVRTGLDAAKLLALGAKMIGIAKPGLQMALQELESGEPYLQPWMEQMERGLKVSLFCRGSASIKEFQAQKNVWSWKEGLSGNDNL